MATAAPTLPDEQGKPGSEVGTQDPTGVRREAASTRRWPAGLRRLVSALLRWTATAAGWVLGFLRRHRHAVAFAVFVLLIGGLYLSVLLGDRSLVTQGAAPKGPLFVIDPAGGGAITLPFERLESIAWSHLHFPVVDPYQGYGIPLLADQGVPVYPLQVIAHLVFPHNYSIWNVVNLMALAFGAYLLASSFGQRFPAALAVGTAAALAGVAPPNVNMADLNPLAVLPFVLVALRYALDPGRPNHWPAWAGTAMAVALVSLSGFQEVLPLFAVVVLVYAAALVLHYRTAVVRPILVAGAFVATVAGVAIGLVGLLPSIGVVQDQASLNIPSSYTSHAPLYWLATLTVPGVAGPSMAGRPQDLGLSLWTLGTPLLVPVLLLAIVLVVRRGGRALAWYVWPSVVLVVVGILGYANLLHVLTLLDLPFFDSIKSVRFLQFAWWIPWCLLLGAVITGARALRWYDALVAAGVSALVDVLLVGQYRHALSIGHLARDLRLTGDPSVDAAVVAGGFLLAVAVGRWVRPGVVAWVLAGAVAASCIFYLPTNFYPAKAHGAVVSRNALKDRGSAAGHLVFVDTPALSFGLPATSYTVQIWGPVIPRPYQKAAVALFSRKQTGGLGPLYGALPTLSLATPDRRLLSLLASLGVDTLVTAGELPAATFGVVAGCAASAHPVSGASTAVAATPHMPASALAAPQVCVLEHKAPQARRIAPPTYVYDIEGSSPLVDAAATPVAVPTNKDGLERLVRQLSPRSRSLPSDAYVTSPGRRLLAARGVRAWGRRATTEDVRLHVAAASAGLVVLREAAMAGMRATVNGRAVTVRPVDGGLWTAVPVGAGRSRIVLQYVSVGDQVGMIAAAGGLAAGLLAWVAIGAIAIARRLRSRRSSSPPRPQP